MSSNFFAMLSRLKYIDRWALMRNTSRENLSEHCMQTAAVAHALAVLGNRRFNKSYNAERAALLGLYHDAPEIITGDMPTPVKYYSSEIREAYKKVEDNACDRLIKMLPQDLREDYAPLLVPDKTDSELWALVKAADKICALIKCTEEQGAGNSEFKSAAEAARKAIAQLNMCEADEFLKDFMQGFELTIDELEK